MKKKNLILSDEEKKHLIKVLEERFQKNTILHADVAWEDVLAKLQKNPQKLWTVFQMENTGGEPDVFQFKNSTGFVFVDCSVESPKGRRSVCYDLDALNKRKEHKPAHSAMEFAIEMGATVISEQQYYELQSRLSFDLKTSSWVSTPEKIRNLGGALFCDRRYETVFTYHNGADSYYAARGFRVYVEI